MDPLSTFLLIAAIVAIVDLVLMGGAMTMTGMSAMGGVLTHPLGAAALLVLAVVALVTLLGGVR